jgi:hypothetical protein
MAFMDTPEFRTHKEGLTLHAGFKAGLQSDSDAFGSPALYRPSLRATGSRACAPDDKLREAIHSDKTEAWIASSHALPAMTAVEKG